MRIDGSSLADSANITSTIYDSIYPSGKTIVSRTSYSEEGGSFSRTLTSRTASDILVGDALYRNPRFSHSFLIRQLDSSLNSLITGGAEAAHNSPSLLTIDNPESSSFELTQDENGQESLTKTMVSGGTAFNLIMAQTIAGRRGGSDFIDSTTRLALSELSNTQRANPDYIAGLAHGNNGYDVMGTTVTTGSRTVVLASAITIEEKNWLLERANLLKSYSTVEDYAYLTSGFSFDIPNGLTNLNQTQTFYPSMQPGNVVEQYLVDAPSATAYICPSVIELLIFLQSKMDYRCRLGVNVSRAAQSTSNTALANNGSVNDHVFGRAFDITYVASKPPSTNELAIDLVTQGTDLSKYRSALDHFLTILSAAPNGLLPDLIVVHGDLSAELGIVSGNEPVDSAIKRKYPKFANVNFQADVNHKTNIHISFSAQRSGQYTGPGGTLGAAGTFLVPITGGPDGALSSVPQAPSPVLGEKFTKNYASSPSETLTKVDIFDLLRGTILSDEAAALMTAVVVRESNARPVAFNPKVTYSASSNKYGGDWSVGLFQSNLLTTAHGTKEMSLPVGTTIANRRKIGYILGYKNYSSEGINENNFNEKMYAKYTEIKNGPSGTHNLAVTQLFPSVDPLVWIPFNQAFILYSVIAGPPAPMPFLSSQRLALTAETGYIFNPWGDYGNGPEKGFITGVNFKDAIDVYESTGKDRILLKRWTLTMFNATAASRSSRSYPYANNWVNGWVYPYDGAPIPPEEELYPYVPGIPGLPSGGPGGTGTDTGGSAYRFPGLSPALTSAMVWAESQIGAPYCAHQTYRFGDPTWPGGTLTGFRGDVYTFPEGTRVYDCSGFVIAVYRRAGIDFLSMNIGYSQAFNTPDLPDAQEPYRAGDIAVYAPDLAGVGHVVMIHSRNTNGTYKTIEAAGGDTDSVAYKTLRPERTIAVKRPLP